METPIILVPGIKGTTLVNINTLNFDTIYSGVQSVYETIADLELREDALFETSPRAIIERGDVEDLAYREIVSQLSRKTPCPVYIFGYDWRKSCHVNGRKLKRFVEYLKAKLGAEQFHFVTHSMGGVVFGCFLKELRGQYALVNKAVLTVCPFLGSIHALISLIVGEGGIKFPLFNSNDEFRKIARTFPSVYELIPMYQDAVVCESKQPFDLYNRKQWQSNIADDSMFQRRLQELREFRNPANPAAMDLRQLPEDVRQRMLIVAGRNERTKVQVTVNDQTSHNRVTNFFDFDNNSDDGEASYGDGDGTVPFQSAIAYKGDIVTLAVRSKWTDGATHGFFLNDGRVQTIIKRFLNAETEFPEWWNDISGSVTRV